MKAASWVPGRSFFTSRPRCPKIPIVISFKIVYTRAIHYQEGQLMKIASFILKTAAVALAAASVACAVVAHLCASLRDAD